MKVRFWIKQKVSESESICTLCAYVCFWFQVNNKCDL